MFFMGHSVDQIDMVINERKSCCMRIGPRYNIACAPISTCSGTSIAWTDNIRYLGVTIVRSRTFKCFLDHAKKSFYRSANSIFGKVGRTALEEVVLQLIRAYL